MVTMTSIDLHGMTIWVLLLQIAPFAMTLQGIWKNYKVLIVMGSSLGLIHLGWYHLKANPLLHKSKEELVPKPGIVTYVSPSSAAPAARSQWTEQVCHRKPPPLFQVPVRLPQYNQSFSSDWGSEYWLWSCWSGWVWIFFFCIDVGWSLRAGSGGTGCGWQEGHLSPSTWAPGWCREPWRASHGQRWRSNAQLQRTHGLTRSETRANWLSVCWSSSVLFFCECLD